MLTTIVRVACVLVDVAILAAAAVAAAGAAVRFHRRGLERIRLGGPVAEPRSNVVPLHRRAG